MHEKEDMVIMRKLFTKDKSEKKEENKSIRTAAVPTVRKEKKKKERTKAKRFVKKKSKAESAATESEQVDEPKDITSTEYTDTVAPEDTGTANPSAKKKFAKIGKKIGKPSRKQKEKAKSSGKIGKKFHLPKFAWMQKVQETFSKIPILSKIHKPTKKSGKIRILTFSRKMLLLCAAPMIIICVLVASFSSRSLSKAVEGEIKNALTIVAVSLDETYSNLYEGDYVQNQSGKITKGDVAISGNTDLINALKERTNFEITLYFNEMRLVTTLKNDAGAPANGTPADADMYKQVMEGKTVFKSDVELYGKKYYVLYQPLVNADGSIPGAVAVAKDATSVQKTIAAQTTQIIIISIVLVLVTGAIIIWLTSRMVVVMKSTKHFLGRLAEGEFSVMPKAKHMNRNDELGDIYRSSASLQQELRKIVNHIKQSSADLIQSADQLTDVAKTTRDTVDTVCQSMEGITEGSATQTEETTIAIGNVEKIANEITHISSIMDSLTRHANQMSDAEQASEEIVRRLNDSNDETIATISEVSEQITTLHNSVASIQKAITMIQSIAEETDLLSLNANIEAARAGEAGKGFSVVATQISKLADQSNSTAENVEDIIVTITEEADRMVEIMNDVKDKITEQQERLGETMERSSQVAQGVRYSLQDINRIRGKMDVLNQSGDAIQDIVHNLAAISKQNEASTQDTMSSALGMSQTMNSLEASSANLKKLANELDQSLVRFKM